MIIKLLEKKYSIKLQVRIKNKQKDNDSLEL